MTQAFNLAQLANNLNTSGQLDATDGLSGLVPLANGGTGASNTVNTVVAGTGISVSTSGTQVTVTNTSSASGTVTSVATGNGLQGGTITSTGTLSVACPAYNTVGSYVLGGKIASSSSMTSGSNYAAGTGDQQVQRASIANNSCGQATVNLDSGLSGTWKLMANTLGAFSGGSIAGLFCRVS